MASRTGEWMQFGDIRLRSLSLTEANQVLNMPVQGSEMHLHFVAVSSITSTVNSRNLIEVFSEGVSIVDSKPLAIALNVLGFKCRNLRGTDFFRFAIESEEGRNRHFLLGSTDETLQKIQVKAKSINPKFEIVGAISPNFSSNFEKEYSSWNDEFKRTEANIIWIGLGSPKQDFLASALTQHFSVRTIAVGAAFDFFGETVKEAPLIFRKLSLEWFYRLITEPKRLWKRYLFGNFQFMYMFFVLLLKTISRNFVAFFRKLRIT